MSHSSRAAFLRKDTEPCTTSITPCPICYETITSSTALDSLSIRFRNTKTVARMLFSGCRSGSSRLKPRPKPSRSNCTVRIKGCGHRFCYDCLETWVQKKNTCPMCRDRLFLDARHDKHSDDIIQEDMEQWLALGEHGNMRDMNDPAIRGALGDGDNHQGGEGMQDNADENEMHAGMRSDRTEAMLGQRKTE